MSMCLEDVEYGSDLFDLVYASSCEDSRFTVRKLVWP